MVKGRANIRTKSILGGAFLFVFGTVFLYIFLGLVKCLAKAINNCTVIPQGA